VLRYLVSQGVNTHRLTATGYADTDPLAPNTSNANRARNRRVEFVMERANP
jgi:chemotaxis protein MotB